VNTLVMWCTNDVTVLLEYFDYFLWILVLPLLHQQTKELVTKWKSLKYTCMVFEGVSLILEPLGQR